MSFHPNWGYAQDDPFESLTDDEVQELLRLLGEAEAAYSEERWSHAAYSYGLMWEILPLEEYRFAQAICFEELGEYDSAVAVLSEIEQSARAEVAASARERIDEIEDLVATLPGLLHVTTNPPQTSVVVDGELIGTLGNDGIALELSPGEHRILVESDGYQTQARVAQVAGNQDENLFVELILLDTENFTVPFILGATALAVAGNGLVFGLLAESRAKDARNYNPDAIDSSSSDYQSLTDEVDTFATVANISFIAAGALTVATIVVFVLSGDSEQPSDDDTVSFLPLATPNELGGLISFSF